MSKTGFWLRGSKGKLAGTVMYQSGGRTLQREVVTPKNPRSDAQMRQRVAFAGASKFYQEAQQNRFKLAFSDKKSNQSEFNKFMQVNLKEYDTIVYPTRQQNADPNFCAYFPWVVSKGSLGGIDITANQDYEEYIGIDIFGAVTTWEEFKNSSYNKKYDFQDGDIITLTAVSNDERFDTSSLDVIAGTHPAIWKTRQFIVGADLGGHTLGDYFTLNGFDQIFGETTSQPCLGMDITDIGVTTYGEGGSALMAVCTRSRIVDGETKVSTSKMWLSDMAQKIYTRLSNDTQLRDAIASYKPSEGEASRSEVLQGSVAKEFPSLHTLRYVSSEDESVVTTSTFPATNVKVQSFAEYGNKMACLTIQGENISGDNFSLTGEGLSKTYRSSIYLPNAVDILITAPTSTTGVKAFTLRMGTDIVVSGNADFA